jgi:hypothetical protein
VDCLAKKGQISPAGLQAVSSSEMEWPNMSPALWSAVAATCSALTAFFVMRIQRRNFLESVRPQIVLEGWNRTNHGEPDKLSFNAVRNVGKGVALHIYMNAGATTKGTIDKPSGALRAAMGTTRYPVLASTDRAALECTISLFWENAEKTNGGSQVIPVTIQIFCWDTADRRHETRYELLVFERVRQHQVTSDVAPGVTFGTRRVTHRSVRGLRMAKRVKRPFWWIQRRWKKYRARA